MARSAQDGSPNPDRAQTPGRRLVDALGGYAERIGGPASETDAERKRYRDEAEKLLRFTQARLREVTRAADARHVETLLTDAQTYVESEHPLKRLADNITFAGSVDAGAPHEESVLRYGHAEMERFSREVLGMELHALPDVPDREGAAIDADVDEPEEPPGAHATWKARLRRLGRALAAPLALIPGVVVLPAAFLSALVQLALARFAPALYRAQLFRQMAGVNGLKQAAGAGAGFAWLRRWMPELVRQSHEYANRSPFFSSPAALQVFDAYDPSTDSFRAVPPLPLVPFNPIRPDDEKEDAVLRMWWNPSTSYRHTTKLRGVRVADLLTPEGFVPLPWMEMRREGCALLGARAVRKDGAAIELPLFFDAAGRLFAQPGGGLPKDEALDLEVVYAARRTGMGSSLRGNIKSLAEGKMRARNPLFGLERLPELDPAAETARSFLPGDLLHRIDEWKALPHRAAVEEVRRYFLFGYRYASGPLARARIRRLPGRNDIERISTGRNGNCYDTNRLAYIVLQLLGIPCELLSGIAEGDDDKRASRKEVDGEDIGRALATLPIGTAVTLHDLIRRAHGLSVNRSVEDDLHAFLRWRDLEKGACEVLDVTPSDTFGDADRAKEIETWIFDADITEGDRAAGLAPLAELAREHRELGADASAMEAPWSSGGRPVARVGERWTRVETKDRYQSLFGVRFSTPYYTVPPLDPHKSWRKRPRYLAARRRFEAEYAVARRFVDAGLERMEELAAPLSASLERLYDRTSPSSRGELDRAEFHDRLARKIIGGFVPPPFLLHGEEAWKVKPVDGAYDVKIDGAVSRMTVGELHAKFEGAVARWAAVAERAVADIVNLLDTMEIPERMDPSAFATWSLNSRMLGVATKKPVAAEDPVREKERERTAEETALAAWSNGEYKGVVELDPNGNKQVVLRVAGEHGDRRYYIDLSMAA